MRTAVIAELADRLSSGSGRRNEGIWLFAALVLTAAIPVLLLGGWIAYITADQERSYARKAATEALTQVAHQIEAEISREMQVAETLASSAALDNGNLGDFYLRGNADSGRPPAMGDGRADKAGSGAGIERAAPARRAARTGHGR